MYVLRVAAGWYHAVRKLCRRVSVIFILLPTACLTHYARGDDAVPLNANTEVRIWTHGHLLRWHAVSMLVDSITGIPYKSPLDCDSCRQAIPRAEVDSVIVVNSIRSNAVLAVYTTVLMAVLFSNPH
jgi:hypothetical protein